MAQEKPFSRDVKEIVNDGHGTSREPSGFGDSLATTERMTYASFIPFRRDSKTVELNTSVSFTPPSPESSCTVSSKFDVVTISNSDDEVFSARKQGSVFEVRRSECMTIWHILFDCGYDFRDILDRMNSIRKFLVMETMKE